MPQNSSSQSVSAFEEEQPGHRRRNAAKITESKRLAVCGRRASKSECRETHRVKAFLRLRKKYDLEQVAEAYMLKRDHPNSKATEFRQPGHRSWSAAKLIESKRFAVCNSCLITSSGSIHAQEGSPEIQRQLNFGNRGIDVGMPRNSPSQSLSPLEEESECRENHRVKAFGRLKKKSDVGQVAEAYMLKRDHPNSKATEFRQTGHRSRNAAKLTESKPFYKSDVEQAAEAYMLKRDHPNSKATEFRQPGHRSRNAAKLTESKRLAVCGRSLITSSGSIHAQEGSTQIQRQLNFGNRGIDFGMPRNSPSQSVWPFAEERVKAFLRLRKKYDVEQVAEAYMLKRDQPNSKATEFRQTGAIDLECRETHRVKAFRRLRKNRNAAKTHRLRKKYDVEQVAEAYMLKRDHPNSKATEFRQPGHRSLNAAKLTESKCFAVCGSFKAFRRLQKKSDVEQVAEAYMLKRDHPNSKATEFRQPGHRFWNAAKLTESKRFAVCGRSLT
ncbi:hypothetical protein D5086_033971 [Populus alba]|uniref:Uncharacterized protein n=1 Tax=Populus alba TaxID=43335 RepID=A0ACC4AID8_POPAL